MMCRNKTSLDGSYLMVSVSKFGIDTTENPWYRIDLKKLVSPIPTTQAYHIATNVNRKNLNVHTYQGAIF